MGPSFLQLDSTKTYMASLEIGLGKFPRPSAQRKRKTYLTGSQV